MCHETAGFIGFFLPLKGAALHWMPPAKAAPPPLESQMRFGMRTHKEKNELWAFIPKRTPGSIICYGDLQRVCRNQMTDILRRRKDHPSAASAYVNPQDKITAKACEKIYGELYIMYLSVLLSRLINWNLAGMPPRAMRAFARVVVFPSFGHARFVFAVVVYSI